MSPLERNKRNKLAPTAVRVCPRDRRGFERGAAGELAFSESGANEARRTRTTTCGAGTLGRRWACRRRGLRSCARRRSHWRTWYRCRKRARRHVQRLRAHLLCTLGAKETNDVHFPLLCLGHPPPSWHRVPGGGSSTAGGRERGGLPAGCFLGSHRVCIRRASCWQPGAGTPTSPGVSEDCLYLNVFVPQNVVSSEALDCLP